MVCLFEKCEDLEEGWITFYWGHQEKFHEGGNISMGLWHVKIWLADGASRYKARMGKNGLSSENTENDYGKRSTQLIVVTKSTMDLY